MKTLAASLTALALGLGVCGAAQAQDKVCDRACLESVATTVLNSLPRHDAGAVPLSQDYMATENNVPQAIAMMNLWRTVTAVKETYLATDAQTGNVFVIATVAEGATESLLFGRLKIGEDAKVSEIELYVDRSRGDAGFQYGLRAPGMMAFPTTGGWLAPVPAGKKASRDELLAAGKSIFDRDVQSPPISENCVMMENGQRSNENPDVLKYLLPSDADMSKVQKDSYGMDIVPCAAPPERPTDKNARVTVVDEEKGIVIASAIMSGEDQPYLVENPTTSAFVPNDIMQPYLDVLKAQDATGKFTQPRVRSWPVTASVTELYRYYDGKIQGMLLLFNMEPYGSTSPWVKLVK